MKIAYITYNGVMKYSPANNFNETEDLLPFLQRKGLDITAEIWDDPNADWAKYDLALLKTPWDYHHKVEKFKQWLDHMEALNVKMLNSYDTVRWNMDKHYLQDIIQSGLKVIPTTFLDKGWEGELEQLFDELHTDKLIIKPAISGGSKDTVVLDKSAVSEEREAISAMLTGGDFLAQPFLDEVTDGEWSFIFFNGVYSHTIVKKPKTGDFRVQQIFGGTIEVPAAAHQEYIEEASKYVTAFAANTLYARVDGLMVNQQFMLMELELIEPYLYLSYHPQAVERYYEALKLTCKAILP